MPACRPAVLSRERQRLAEQHLLKSDRVMARLVRRHGKCRIGGSGFRPFHALATAIISQQLSTKAAETIAARVAVHAPRPFEPDSMLAVAPESLRAAGLSGAKARYIQGLAQRVVDGSLDFARLRKLHDEAAIAALTEVPGVGRWTAEMFLIFTLRRPDILSLGDAGLSRAVRTLYGDRAKLHVVGERWRPYRSVASWYLWRHLDGN